MLINNNNIINVDYLSYIFSAMKRMKNLLLAMHLSLACRHHLKEVLEDLRLEVTEIRSTTIKIRSIYRRMVIYFLAIDINQFLTYLIPETIMIITMIIIFIHQCHLLLQCITIFAHVGQQLLALTLTTDMHMTDYILTKVIINLNQINPVKANVTPMIFVIDHLKMNIASTIVFQINRMMIILHILLIQNKI